MPASSQIHPVFHISQLKPFIPDYTPVFGDLPKLVDRESANTEPESILQHRLVKKCNTTVPHVWIKWTNLSPEVATWEDYSVVKKRFPNTIAFGQATYEATSTVT